MQSKKGIIFLMILLSLMILVSDDKAQPQQSQSDRLRPDLKLPELNQKQLPKVPKVKEPPEAKPATPESSVAYGSVTGKLIREMAIGGETSGWAVVSKGHRVSIDPAGIKIDKYENKKVYIFGPWSKRSGIERGEYMVIVVKKIRLVK